MIQIYLAGNYSEGDTASYERRLKNLETHKQVYRRLLKAGYAVFSPILQSHHLADSVGAGPQHWMAVDIEGLSRCDGLVSAHPFEKISPHSGTAKEIWAAWWLEKPLYDFVPSMYYSTSPTGTYGRFRKLAQKTGNYRLCSSKLKTFINPAAPPLELLDGPYLPWSQGLQCHKCFSRGWVRQPEQVEEHLHLIWEGDNRRLYTSNTTVHPPKAVPCPVEDCNAGKLAKKTAEEGEKLLKEYAP